MTEEEAKSMGDLFPDLGPEAPVISCIAHDRSEALATVRGVRTSRVWPPRCSPSWPPPA